MKITKLMAVLLLLALVLTVPAAAAETLPPIYVGYQKLEAIPDRWNPLEALTPAGEAVLDLISEPLYRVDETGSVVSAQAAAMPRDITAEFAGSYGIPKTALRGYAFEITLREGARWEDGSAVTAGDWYYTVNGLLEQGRFPLEIAGYREFVAGETKPAEKIRSLMDAGFESVAQAEAAGYKDFYIDVTNFWGLEEGWLPVSDRTPLKDAAIPSGCGEMYLTAEYLYLHYLAEGGSQTMFQAEFVGIPVEEGQKLTMEDVGLIHTGDSLVLILRQPVTSGYLALTLGQLHVARETDFGSCGPYRVVSSTTDEIVLEPNPNWTGEQPLCQIVRCRAD